MTLLKKRIAEAIQDKRLLCIFRDFSEDDVLTCTISQISDHLIVLTEFTGDGDYDGISVIPFDGITRVNWGDQENESITTLIESKGMTPNVLPLKLKSFSQAIEELNQRYGYVALHMDNDAHCYVGSVVEMDHEFIEQNQYGSKSKLERYHTIIKTENIARVQVDSIYERNLLTLYP